MNGLKNHLMVGNMFASVVLGASLIHGQSSTALARPPANVGASVAAQNSLTLPFAGATSTSGIAFSVRNTGTGTAIQGQAARRPGLMGISSVHNGVHGTTGTSNGVYGTSTGANSVGVKGYTSAGAYGVYGHNDNPKLSAGVQGRSTKWYGVRGDSVEGQGVWGESQSSAGVVGKSQTWVGSFGESVSSTGVAGKSTTGAGTTGESRDWVGVYGVSNNFEGVRGESRNSTHGGVVGVNSAGGPAVFGAGFTGNAIAGVGSGGGSTGVYGRSDGNNGNGLVGEANNGTSAYGIWGKSTSGYAGVFSGKVAVYGNLSKGGGSFKIDHPLAPDTKYLSHSFVESPDMMNIYNGNATLNAKGETVVTMPNWFEALNMEFRYQLTPLGAPGPGLFVSQEISNNRFTIAGGKAGGKVSWQVTGVRHDAFANANRIPVEEDKPASEVGTYLYPREHGKPTTAGLQFRNEQALRERATQTQARPTGDIPSQPTK
jgi:hypothetical protein